MLHCVEPEDASRARVSAELDETRKLLGRGDADGARIAAWAAFQLAERDRLPDLAAECLDLIRQCDMELVRT